MRRRLGLVTLAVTLLIVISFVVPLGILVRRQAEDRALSGAESDARAIATALAVASTFSGVDIDEATASAVLAAFGSPAATSIHLPDGTVVGDGSRNDPDVAVAREGNAFTARTDDGAAVLVPVVLARGTSVVRVGVADADLMEGVAQAWLILGALAVLLITVALAGADRLGRSIVAPVTDLRRAAAALGAGNLEARVRPGGPPEIADVGRTFNELAARLRGLLQAEREAAADLSHSLRTPLAALRLQVESLDPTIREQLLDDVIMVEATVDRVITEARSAASDLPPEADLMAVARDRAEFWSVLAAEQERLFDTRLPGGQTVVAVPTRDLTTALDTLLENVFTHTPAGAAIRLSVDAARRAVIVEDGGPGFDASTVTRGSGGGRSTGLGLDIVRRIAARSGGTFTVDRSDLGGARVTVAFGAPERVRGAPKSPSNAR